MRYSSAFDALVLGQSLVEKDGTFAKFVSCKFELLNDPNSANDIAQCRQLSRISIKTSVYFVVDMTHFIQFHYFNEKLGWVQLHSSYLSWD